MVSITDFASNLEMYFLLLLAMMVYFSAILWVVAGKTGTPGSWMAWVPLLNVVLMCRVARKPLWYILLLLIPIVNLVAAILIWMGIAKARGKGPILGVLMVVPLVNLVAAVAIAVGPANSQGTAVAPAAAAPLPTVCPACGREECVSEEFCGYTGERIRVPAAAPAIAAAAPGVQSEQPGMLAKVILGLILTFGGAYFGAGLLASAKKFFGAQPGGSAAVSPNTGQSGSVPQGPATGAMTATGAVPRRAAGTLTEFPVDTAAMPARPTSVTAQSLRSASRGREVKLPPHSLPPGLTPATLGRVGDSITTATYQSAGQSPVSVHVLASDGGPKPAAGILARYLEAAGSAQATGIRVQSPSGAEYTGFRVRTPENETYIMDKTGQPVTVLIFAPDASAGPVADRLAANVGNGNGLLDDPAISASLASLPRQLPAGLELAESNAYTGASLSGSLDQLSGSLSNSFGPESRTWIDKARRFIPPQLSTARYVDSAGREFTMAVGDYGGSMRAWLTWQLLRATVGLAGMQSLPMNGGSALTAHDLGKQSVLFTRGAYLGYVTGPDERVVTLASSVSQ